MSSMSSETVHLVAMALVNGISSVVGIIGNALVLAVLLKNKEYLQGINLFIAALAVADLILCSLVQPVFIYGLFYESSDGDSFQAFGNNVFSVLIQVSFNLLLFIAISRLMEISYPFFYRTFGTKIRIAVVILVVCVIGVVQGILFNHHSNKAMRTAEPFFQYTTITAFVVIYVKLYFIARKHQNEIRCQTRSLAFNHASTITIFRLTRLRTSTITTGLITGAFVVCFLPFSIINLMDNENHIDTDDHEVLKFWVSTVVSCNSSMNAYIYTLRSQNFKNAVKKVIRSSRCCKRN